MHEEERTEDLPMTTEEAKERGELAKAWREVGEQFQQLGSKLADALRRSWATSGEQPESEETMRRLRDDLRATADRIDQAIRQAKDETTGERESTMRATREASEKSLEEARSLTASTLRKLNTQLERLAERLEREETEAGEREKHE
jgi:predicted  nucleic acid-binding Zn-ribbon protein